MTVPKQDDRIARADLDRAVELAVGKAVYKLLSFEPFWACLLLKMERFYTRAIPTMATDGVSLYVNPDWTATLPVPEIVGVLLHETLHKAFGHCLRRGNRNPRKWNRACDYAVNQVIIDSANFTPALAADIKYCLPTGALIDPKYKGMRAEAIYDLLKDEDSDGEGPGGSGAASGDDLFDHPGGGKPGEAPSPADLDAGERDLKSDLKQAQEISRKAGKGSSMGDRLVEAAETPSVDWKALLQRFCDQVDYSDYSWHRPNRRYISSGQYLPGRVKEDGLGAIAVWIDTSGSVGNEEISQFMAEIKSIVETNPKKVYLGYCDSEVQRVDVFEAGEEIKVNAPQGGGTDFRPPFAWMEENADDVIAAIYLTDLYGQAPDKSPDFPVFWGCITDQVAAWGETVKVTFGKGK